MDRAPTPGPLRPGGAGRAGRSWWPTTAQTTAPAPAWNGGPNVTRASTWWTPRPVEGRRRHATSGSGRPAALCWPSATPTTWCGRAGSPPCGRPWPTPTWWPACSTSAPWTEPRARSRFRRPHGNWDFSLSASAPTWPSAGRSSRRCTASTKTVAGRGHRSVLAAATGGVPVRGGDRCRRGETRACRGPAHVPCRLGLRTVRSAALRALPR